MISDGCGARCRCIYCWTVVDVSCSFFFCDMCNIVREYLLNCVQWRCSVSSRSCCQTGEFGLRLLSRESWFLGMTNISVTAGKQAIMATRFRKCAHADQVQCTKSIALTRRCAARKICTPGKNSEQYWHRSASTTTNRFSSLHARK